MKKDQLKIAAYLEEADEDPLSACKVLRKHNIDHVALKHIWSGNVCSLSDNALMSLRKILVDEGMTIMLVASDLGVIEAHDLMRTVDEDIHRVFNIVSYFKSPFVRIAIGTKSQRDCLSVVKEWMNRITETAIAANITPLLEITPNSYLFTPADVANHLAEHRRWKLLYDPVQFVLKQKLDPFVRYWSLLKNYTAIIDVRDIKIGKGFKPVGFGDTKIDLTIRDSLSNYCGWYILEPSLGRKHGTAITKADTFHMAFEAFENVLQNQN